LERKLDRFAFEAAVVAEAGGWVSSAERAELDANPLAWTATLRRLIHETDDGIRSACTLTGELRELVMSDLTGERSRLSATLLRLTGDAIEVPPLPSPNGTLASTGPNGASGTRTPGQAGTVPAGEATGTVIALESGPPVLQASWAEGRIVVWAGGPGAEATPEDLEELLDRADATSIAWERHPPVPIPGRPSTEARSAPIAQTLGWLVGVGAGQAGDGIGPSLRWAGEIALWGTELVAQGRMVPVVRGASSAGSSGRQGAGRHRVRWVPALVGRERLHDLVTRMPTSVVALQPTAARPTRCAVRSWLPWSMPSPEPAPAGW
jgi:hypothetical protein